MSELSAQQDSSNILKKAAKLYKDEVDAVDKLNLSAESHMFSAGYKSEEELLDSEDDYVAELDEEAIDNHIAAVEQSDRFAAAHMDELHEAAIKEAAARVADIYATMASKK